MIPFNDKFFHSIIDNTKKTLSEIDYEAIKADFKKSIESEPYGYDMFSAELAVFGVNPEIFLTFCKLHSFVESQIVLSLCNTMSDFDTNPTVCLLFMRAIVQKQLVRLIQTESEAMGNHEMSNAFKLLASTLMSMNYPLKDIQEAFNSVNLESKYFGDNPIH